jgi:hypothetical protein
MRIRDFIKINAPKLDKAAYVELETILNGGELPPLKNYEETIRQATYKF